jgi:hypothetical protein
MKWVLTLLDILIWDNYMSKLFHVEMSRSKACFHIICCWNHHLNHRGCTLSFSSRSCGCEHGKDGDWIWDWECRTVKDWMDHATCSIGSSSIFPSPKDLCCMCTRWFQANTMCCLVWESIFTGQKVPRYIRALDQS